MCIVMPPSQHTSSLPDAPFSSNFDSESFFTAKSKTSDNTLCDKLKLFETEEELNKICNQVWKHKHSFEKLESYEKHQSEFLELASQLVFLNVTLCFYGYGSKKILLDEFGAFCRNQYNGILITVCGFQFNLNLSNIIRQLREGLGLKRQDDLMKTLAQLAKDDPIFLVFHNIDGPCLQNDESQHFIAKLSAIPRLYLITSYDHVYANLLWDHRLKDTFNFIFHDWTTFRPYHEELATWPMLITPIKDITPVIQAQTQQLQLIFQDLLSLWMKQENTKHISISLTELFATCTSKFLCKDRRQLVQMLKVLENESILKIKSNEFGQISIIAKVCRDSLKNVMLKK